MIDTLRSVQIWLTSPRRGRGDDGASLVEYAMLIALIALVCFVGVGILGQETASELNGAGQSFVDIRNN